ncbi:probable pyridoxal 5'-phosphate synthase subunit PDX1.1 [Zingiber officinale]|uniref:probable pyridoxal 5'-phosphate synthase subunit PDX1.1 n=1 Tax=Zingiber officinale TaxID=94328 RepID=UPI001C4D6C64|nr:probable pyridoxal 5'-phosphate synthase subunit PDX1.1 [Zingiber officinale]
MPIVTPEQARIAEEAGACAVMALERVPADIRSQGGVARMSDPDDQNHINKHNFLLPEALRRIREGAAMIRTKGEVGTGNIIEAVRHLRSVVGGIRALSNMDDDEVFAFAKRIAAPYDLVMQTKRLGRLPVVQATSIMNPFTPHSPSPSPSPSPSYLSPSLLPLFCF